eukprot:Partr_v1_DN28855_c0_g1_i3_m33838 putative nuclease
MLISYSSWTATLFATVAIIRSGPVDAWGYAGHQLSASIAEAYLDNATIKAIYELLPDGQDLAKISTWADEIKRRPEYRFTSQLHYVNPKDDEPRVCSFNYVSDCPDKKCVVGAIYNYTERLDPKTALKKDSQLEALKFVTHFIPDLHQPLHVSGREKGGNGAAVRFLGVKSNLHSVWDSGILMKRISLDFDGDFKKYLEYLLAQIKSEWKAEVAVWNTACKAEDKQPSFIMQAISRFSPMQDIFSAVNKKVICPETWALESNKVNCKTVWPGYDATEGELKQDYYEEGIVAVEKQLAKGGLRLAAALNALF